MAYIDGFVIAVPTANRQKFIEHADRSGSAFMDHGATRVVECWGDDVPEGKTTDFQGAVAATDDETVAFAWIEWPDKATRDALMGRMDALGKTDERFDPAKNPMPFDGQRVIYGGFQPIVERGAPARNGYVQGFVLPVRTARREAYRTMAEEAWTMFQEFGALRVVEAWGDEVHDGKLTDFRRAVKAEPDETIVFAFMEWPSRQVCDAAAEKMMKDDRMKPPRDAPFDARRMIYAGFTPIVTLEK